MATKFKFNYNNQTVDFDDYYVRSDIFTQGNLWNWGLNNSGELGNNYAPFPTSSAVQTVTAGISWKFVGSGYAHRPAIKSDGTLWVWGANSLGQLGDNTSVDKSSPVQTITGGTNWVQIAGGRYHTAGIKTDGSLWLWGGNNYGQLGDNTVISKSSPVQTVALGNNWLQVYCGGNTTAAIKTDGTLWLWGYNGNGTLGDNTSVSKSSPIQTISTGSNWLQVTCGYGTCAGIKTDGTLWLWGRNYYGECGINSTTVIRSPIQTVSLGNNWKYVSCGGNGVASSVAAIKTDGTLWVWGRNAYFGTLGDNTTINRSSPVQTITGGNNWKSVTVAPREHMVAIKIDGTLWCWGLNGEGQLGDNTMTARSSPVQTIVRGTNWKQAACGQSSTVAISYIN